MKMPSLTTVFESPLFHFVTRLRVSHKIWIGFGLLITLVMLVAGLSIHALNRAEQQMSRVVDVSQPAMLQAFAVTEALNRANGALGFYLLSKEPRDRDEYESMSKALDQGLKKLASLPVIANDASLRQRVAEIRKDVDRFLAYQPRMLELAVNDNKNFPGVGFSAREMAPLASAVQQNLGTMIDAERDEDATPERKALLEELAELRQLWMNELIANRAFIAFRGDRNVQNLRLYRDGFMDKVGKIKALGEDVLNFEQAEAIDNIDRIMREYFKLQDKLIAVHNSDKWRTDAWLLRSEIGPLVSRIKQ
ncbi:MAG TPA: hypothetical protein ENI93_01105, partial [Gammaproteobacteria bacterium]|nr:hypothetical protein [Gammaproteobacteria bacterium]